MFYTLVQQGGALVDRSRPASRTVSIGSGHARRRRAANTTSSPVPAMPVGQNTSHNWSGYAATSGTYTGITGTWTVPVPGINGTPGVGATWVGIGGVTGQDLIQAGTQDVAAGGGQAQFQTWIEMLPQASQ